MAEVARSFGVSWSNVGIAFGAELANRIEDPERIEGVYAMGVDETGFLAATKDYRRICATWMVDASRVILREVIEGRSAKILADRLAARPIDWLSGVGVVTIDQLEAYRNGLSPSFAHVFVVADPFRVVRLANRAIDEDAGAPRTP